MLGATMLGLNATGWLKESDRSQREYLTDSARAASNACDAELRAAKVRGDSCC